jgi:hypothetical protein
VTIGSVNTGEYTLEKTLPEGVVVSAGSGSVSATPNAAGVATLTFPTAGVFAIQAHAPESVPSDVYTVCVHNGNDGNCGTTAPGQTTTSTTTGASLPVPYKGPYALVPTVTGITEHRTFTKQTAPQLLSGTVTDRSAVTSVSLILRREYRGRCYAYEGVRERFLKAQCGHGTPFKASSSGTYSYLLPAKLAPGRYVLDVIATDAAGNTTTLARGSSRLVFYVR